MAGEIKVRAKLHGVFRTSRFKLEVRNYPPGVRVREVVESLRLPEHSGIRKSRSSMAPPSVIMTRSAN
jgi:hypothetical protein